MEEKHKRRVRAEMVNAGVSMYGLLKHESRTLHEIIHQDENIQALVYGRSPSWDGVMLIATNRRVIFYDRKPGTRVEDEISYDMIGGVTHGQVGIWSTVVLHTRLGDYKVRYANPSCAQKFSNYIEEHRIEKFDELGLQLFPIPKSNAKHAVPDEPREQNRVLSSSAAEIFLKSRDTGILSTVDKTGRIHGAAIYYYGPMDGVIYIVTKSRTQKANNILVNKQVALTVYDGEELQTVQLQGMASIENDEAIKKKVMGELIEPKMKKAPEKQPPISKIDKGHYVFIKIIPTDVKFYDYKLKELNQF